MDQSNVPPSSGSALPTPTAATTGRTEPLAITSLVLSCLGLVCCGFLLAVPGLICGHIALGRINKDPGLQGRGMALAGVIIGYVGTIVSILWLIFGGLAVVQGMIEGMNQQ